MFSERNKDLLIPNSRGEYFFDRSSSLFDYILNAYRTGEIEVPTNVPERMFKLELDYFQMPIPQSLEKKLNIAPPHHCRSCINRSSSISSLAASAAAISSNIPTRSTTTTTTTTNNNSNNDESTNSASNTNNNRNEADGTSSPNRYNLDNNNNVNSNNNVNNSNSHNDSSNNNNDHDQLMLCGEGLKRLSLEKARQDAGEILSLIKSYCYITLLKAAEQGKQSEIIQFKESDHPDFYSFVSNLRNRELLLHELVQDNFDVYFSEEFGRYYHSYLFHITFWSRYTAFDISSTDRLLNELRQKMTQLTAFLYKNT
ncbi:hypothetical protein CYY_007870 [Polysphondylium violaceum]|uniref:Potassium channel tetramerisation-type BTB domain-containing protein n=1 Tax=Polysphondylium violaceum TaxID=133409 RepID=A0A8J4PP65_9MYCE|nr:hypothetical protein CYY_007870 [Polysphondylium violaceum]